MGSHRGVAPRAATRGAGKGTTARKDSLSITDNRTGSAYEIPVTDGTVHSVDPITQLAGPTLSQVNFTDNVGAGRIITMTFQVLPEPGAALLQLFAIATLGALGLARSRSG